MQKRVLVGAIKSALGVKGEVRLVSFCARGEDIFHYGPLSDESGDVLYEIKIGRAVKGGFAGRLKGVETREAAMGFKNTELYAARENMPPPQADEFYHSDLIGLAAHSLEGEVIGRIATVFNHGAGDILDIRCADKSALLLAFTRESVPLVDLKGGFVTICPPDEACG